MNIVVLDKLDMLDKHINRLKAFGDVVVYNDIPDKATTITRLNKANIAIIGWTTLTRDMIRQFSQLRYISLALTAYELVDIEAARKQGISVSNVPGYSRQSVAEYAFGLALASMRRIIMADQTVRAGNAVSPPEAMLGYELYNKTLGVIGIGNIGAWVAKIGTGFGMRVLGSSRTAKNLVNVEQVALDDLLRMSDVIIICVDINPSTKNLLSREKLSLLKSNSIIVNITSNQCLDEDALTELLNIGNIHGAAFDDISHTGYDDEKKPFTSPLLNAKNVILSPQAGWYTIDAQERLLDIAVSNVEAYVRDEPQNIVN